jgi:hypothetical protein
MVLGQIRPGGFADGLDVVRASRVAPAICHRLSRSVHARGRGVHRGLRPPHGTSTAGTQHSLIRFTSSVCGPNLALWVDTVDGTNFGAPAGNFAW